MCDRSLRRRLMELGIVPGSQVEITETKIGHIVKVLGATYALQKDAVEAIENRAQVYSLNKWRQRARSPKDLKFDGTGER